MRRALAALLAILFLSAGCRMRPSFEAVEEKDIAVDSERRILAQVNKESEIFDKSGFVYDDKPLEAYVNAVARAVQGPRAADKRIVVKIVRDPYLNAYAYPNGKIYINTGFLAAMDNEAQLANLLGHEITHVLRRHAAREFTSMKKKSTVETGSDSLRTIVMASNFYSQTLESEADREGLALMARAGYDPRESVKMFQLLKRQADQEKIKIKLAYSDHPAIKERIKSTTEIVSREYPGREGNRNADEFNSATLGLLLDNAELDLKRANYVLAQQGIEKYLAKNQKDARSYYLLASCTWEKGPQHNDEKAGASYLKAISLKAAYAEPYRGLGLLKFGMGKKAEARENFERYLDLQPAAADKNYIRQFIRASR